MRARKERPGRRERRPIEDQTPAAGCGDHDRRQRRGRTVRPTVPRRTPWLADHTVDGTVIVPGTALVDMAIRAGDEAGHSVLDELVIQTPLVLDRPTTVQVTVGPTEPDGHRPVTIHTRHDNNDWTEHATGTPSPNTRTHPPHPTTGHPPKHNRSTSPTSTNA
ncbi:polyketide synthase dehydratase domain-containing protein [Streptomyces sp. GMY02]|uniref:polyketide synthase dehydratase domain-containing protein n=1 Tax=Streptomyces sp. GMY02 TaxID=1333528 RepID=UPI001C2CC012|nr:polyketide synthase dehydratase domain-containing protein [Streptomyces sp. GMY02]